MALSSISERAVCRHSDLTLALRCGEGWRWFICSASVDQYRLAGCPERPCSTSLSWHTRTGTDGGHHKPEGMGANAGGLVRTGQGVRQQPPGDGTFELPPIGAVAGEWPYQRLNTSRLGAVAAGLGRRSGPRPGVRLPRISARLPPVQLGTVAGRPIVVRKPISAKARASLADSGTPRSAELRRTTRPGRRSRSHPIRVPLRLPPPETNTSSTASRATSWATVSTVSAVTVATRSSGATSKPRARSCRYRRLNSSLPVVFGGAWR